MPLRLTATSAERVAETAFRFEVLAEGHRQFMSNHLEEAKAIYDEWTANPPTINTDCLDEIEAEMSAFPDTDDVKERYRAVTNCIGIAFKRMEALCYADEDAYYEALRIRAQLHRDHLNLNGSSSEVSQPFPLAVSDPTVVPDVIDSPGFSSATVSAYPNVPVSAAELEDYKRSPDQLLGHIFIFGEGGNFLRVVGRQITLSSRCFLVEFGDAGRIAYLIDEKDVYGMLRDAKHVPVPEGVIV